MRSVFALLLLLCACRTPPLDFDGGVPGSDLAVGGDAGAGRDLAGPRTQDLSGSPTSCCGKAGNPGNELGVGKFCQSSTDCLSKPARTCATTFAPTLTFCTMACSMNGPTNQCGSGAICQCAQSQCACVPSECITPPPGC